MLTVTQMSGFCGLLTGSSVLVSTAHPMVRVFALVRACWTAAWTWPGVACAVALRTRSESTALAATRREQRSRRIGIIHHSPHVESTWLPARPGAAPSGILLPYRFLLLFLLVAPPVSVGRRPHPGQPLNEGAHRLRARRLPGVEILDG